MESCGPFVRDRVAGADFSKLLTPAIREYGRRVCTPGRINDLSRPCVPLVTNELSVDEEKTGAGGLPDAGGIYLGLRSPEYRAFL